MVNEGEKPPPDDPQRQVDTMPDPSSGRNVVLDGGLFLDPADPTALIGQTLDGRYRIDHFLGAGGMGAVYKGHQLTVGREVAIKVLYSDQTTAEGVLRFEREARAASSLSHPNTITVFDYGRSSNLNYIVMELVKGRTLSDLIAQEGPLPAQRAGHIVCQLLASLSDAHSHGVVHRDIKPDNLLLTQLDDDPDHVIVLDFGIAWLENKARRDVTLTQKGVVFGTPKYMSPEQALSHEIDARSDLYSTGCVLYNCLTGRPPFIAEDPVSLLIQHVHDAAPRFAEAYPGLFIAPELEAVTFTAMEKDREARFATARDMRRAVRAAADLEPSGPIPPPKQPLDGPSDDLEGPIVEGPGPDGDTVFFPDIEEPSSILSPVLAGTAIVLLITFLVFLFVGPCSDGVVESDADSSDLGTELSDSMPPEVGQHELPDPVVGRAVLAAKAITALAVPDPPFHSWIQVRVRTRPRGAAVRVRDRTHHTADGLLLFDPGDGDEVELRISANHYLSTSETLDLGEAVDGLLEVQIRLSEDPCDPVDGFVEPWIDCD